MSTNTRPQLTEEIVGALPVITGDRFRPNEYILDKRALKGKLGDVTSLFAKAPSIVTGCEVSQGVGTTINVSAGEVLIVDDLETLITLHDSDASALGPVTQPEFISYLPVEQVVNMTVTPLTDDGVTLHYVKARVNRLALLQRKRAGDATLYDAFTADAVEVVVDQDPPSSNEIELARFTSLASSFTFITDNRVSDTYSYVLNDRLLVSGNDVEIGPDGGDLAKLDFQVTEDRTYTYPDRDHRIGALENWVSGANYDVDDHAVFSGILYRCTVSNNDVSFDPAKWQVVGGAGGSSLIHSFSQASPALAAGNPVYFDGTTWQKAKADTNTTVAIGIISEAVHPDYKVQYGGSISLDTAQWDAITGGTGGLIPGETYYTSDVIEGALTTSTPSITNPVLYAISATDAFVVPYFNAAETGAGSDFVFDSFTGDGTTADFTLAGNPADASQIFAFIGGAIQRPGVDFTVTGSILSFTVAPVVGVDVSVFWLNKTVFNTSIDQYVQRATVTLADDAQVILNSAGAVFPTVSNGMYEVWDQSDPTTYGLIAFKDGAPPTFTLRDASTNTVGADTDANLCFFVSGNDMIIRNRLGSSKTFVIHRKI